MALNAEQRQKLRVSVEEASREIAETSMERLREYEAEHGEVRPAPPHANINGRSSKAQTMAVMKRILIANGWLEE